MTGLVEIDGEIEIRTSLDVASEIYKGSKLERLQTSNGALVVAEVLRGGSP